MEVFSCCLLITMAFSLLLLFFRFIHKDEILRTEFGNETTALKAKHKEDLETLKNELEEQHKRNVETILAEREAEHQKQIENVEQRWRCELEESLQRKERQCEQLMEAREIQTRNKMAELESFWSNRVDDLQKQIHKLIHENISMEKSIEEQIETRLHATREKLQALRKEAASLEAVVELRSEEVRALRCQLRKAADAASDASALRERNATLQNTVEGLQAQLQLKTNEERRLQLEIAALTNQCREEMNRSRRISMEKEQLLWKLNLKTDSSLSSLETSAAAENTSSANGDPVTGTPKSRSLQPLANLNLSPIIIEPADEMAEESPTVRNFLEKSASVAYDLQLGDHKLPSPNLPLSPWLKRRNLMRFSSLRWHKSKSH